MIRRKTLKRKISPMSVEKAGDVFKSMSVLHAKRKFQCYKGAFKFLLTLAYENASHINSLQMNNSALAKAIQREKENTATQLKERLLAESRYFELLKEYGILKTKLSSVEQNLTRIDGNVKNSMIPNLVRLSDDITTLKINCDVLRSAIGTREPDTTTRNFPRETPAERANPRIISSLNVPSPVTEESGDETLPLTARKCKGGLRNVFIIPNIRDRRINQSLTSTPELSASFAELNSVEENRTVTSSEVEKKTDLPFEVENSRIFPVSPGIALITSSPRIPPASPAIVLRRVLTPVNLNDLNDSVHSTTEMTLKDKSPSISIEDDVSRVLPRSGRKRFTHSSSSTHHDENNASCSFLTERKKSKRSYFHKGSDESKSHKKSESSRASIHNLNLSSKNEAADDCPSENVQPRKSKSKRKSSRNSLCENEVPPENFSLIGERKQYRTRSVSRGSIQNLTNDSCNLSEVKTDGKKSIPNTTFGNETTSENSLNDSRRLRTRSKTVCYKERSINVKLRKN